MSVYYNLKKVKVIIEYEGKTKSSEIPPYKPINFIKEVSRDLFKNNIGPEIKLKYNNKDLTQFEGNLIGDFFKRKNIIKIKIEDSNSKFLIESSDKKKINIINQIYYVYVIGITLEIIVEIVKNLFVILVE